MHKFTVLITFLCFTFFYHNEVSAQAEFKLEPSQSMLMTGKGPGQDGTINPYDGQDCYAIIENIGKSKFSIRVQQKKKIIETISILQSETKKVKLLKGYELYLDTNSKGIANARVSYEKMDQ